MSMPLLRGIPAASVRLEGHSVERSPLLYAGSSSTSCQDLRSAVSTEPFALYSYTRSIEKGWRLHQLHNYFAKISAP